MLHGHMIRYLHRPRRKGHIHTPRHNKTHKNLCPIRLLLGNMYCELTISYVRVAYSRDISQPLSSCGVNCSHVGFCTVCSENPLARLVLGLPAAGVGIS